MYTGPGAGPGVRGTDRRGGHRRTDRRARPAGRARPDRRRRRPAREAPGGGLRRLHPPARGRAADRPGRPGRLPEPRSPRGRGCCATDAFGIGEIVKVTATGAWSRTVGYWNRSPWAGRRSLHGQPVVDGVVTNPLAHATATALAVIGCREADDVVAVDTDLYRANAIDSDDTSVVRIHTTHGNDRDRRLHALRLRPAGPGDPRRGIPGTRRVLLHDRPARHRGRRADPYGHRRPRGSAREPDGIPPRRGRSAGSARQHRRVHAGARRGRPSRASRSRIDPRAITWSGEGQDRTARGRRHRATRCRRRCRPGRPSPSWVCPGPIAVATRSWSPRGSARPRSSTTGTGPAPSRRPRRGPTCIPCGHWAGSSCRPPTRPTTTGTPGSAWPFPTSTARTSGAAGRTPPVAATRGSTTTASSPAAR